MQKDNPDIFDYNIPQKFRDLYAAKDFGPWTDETGYVPVCFIATNHTTGGNSGSPVINADGHLIGLNFDRVMCPFLKRIHNLCTFFFTHNSFSFRILSKNLYPK